jgi:hypothetical protein
MNQAFFYPKKESYKTFGGHQKTPVIEYSQSLFSTQVIFASTVRNAVHFFLQSASEIKDTKIP